ncbi:hypothetical protein CHUAL_005067 [Chamberlinius hualienensis]
MVCVCVLLPILELNTGLNVHAYMASSATYDFDDDYVALGKFNYEANWDSVAADEADCPSKYIAVITIDWPNAPSED